MSNELQIQKEGLESGLKGLHVSLLCHINRAKFVSKFSSRSSGRSKLARRVSSAEIFLRGSKEKAKGGIF